MHRGKGMKFVGDSRVLAPSERKPMYPKDYSEYPGKTEAFWPNFLLKEWLVGAVFLVGFLCLTVAHEPPLERIADPTDAGYIPLPDWYFLFLYQLLKYSYASSQYTVVGAMVIPGLAFGALLLAPFIDRGPERRASKRPAATAFMLLAIAAIFFLTWQSVATHDWEAAKKQGMIVQGIDKDAEGYKIYEAQGCISCHGGELQGSAGGAQLIDKGFPADHVAEVAKKGIGNMPPGMFKGTDEELKVLSEYISTLKSK